MHCAIENGVVIEHCSADCPLRRQIEELGKSILKSLPMTYSGLCRQIEPADHLVVMLCHLEYYGCIKRMKSGTYSLLNPPPSEMECPFLLFDFT